MADTNTRQLCVEILHTQFGPLTAKLAGILLTRGRLPFPQLVRLSGLKTRTARAAILVLVQHNVLWHSRVEGEPEMFEINFNECLMRLRFGKFVWLTDMIFGPEASEIVQLILDNGKLRPPEIIGPLSANDPKKVSTYTQLLHKLVSSNYLKPSTLLSHISPAEKRIQYETEEKRKISGYAAAKDIRQAKEVAHARLKREEEEEEKVGLKRKLTEQPTGRGNKRKAIEVEEVDDTVYFRVNYERFGVHLRNALFENAAKERFNRGASIVLRAALKATEDTQLSLSDPRSSPTTVANIATLIPEDVNLSEYLVYSSKKVSNFSCVKDFVGMLAYADNPTPEGRNAAFVSSSGSKVQVEFEIIANRLRRNIIECIAREKHGLDGLRILRLLMDTGKLDDKQIAKVVMIATKDVRPLLVAMSSDSLISMQEVPKSADRNPTRTVYLWYADPQKAYATALSTLYKTLGNILARRRAESEGGELTAVLEKCERSDVSQDESLLTRLEREILQNWEQKQEKLSVLEGRVEELVFVLKDLVTTGEKE